MPGSSRASSSGISKSRRFGRAGCGMDLHRWFQAADQIRGNAGVKRTHGLEFLLPSASGGAVLRSFAEFHQQYCSLRSGSLKYRCRPMPPAFMRKCGNGIRELRKEFVPRVPLGLSSFLQVYAHTSHMKALRPGDKVASCPTLGLGTALAGGRFL